MNHFNHSSEEIGTTEFLDNRIFGQPNEGWGLRFRSVLFFINPIA
jgi:hypothetical protein